jgi:hypothetical protein
METAKAGGTPDAVAAGSSAPAPGPAAPDGRARDRRTHQLAPDQQPVAVLEELLIARGERLLRAAIMLAGSHADGEDLLQAALERVYRHWGRIDGDPEGYLRRTLYHLAADGWRRNGMLRDRLRLLRQPAGHLMRPRPSTSATSSSICCASCRPGSGPPSSCATGRS